MNNKLKIIYSMILILSLMSISNAWTQTTPPNSILDELGFRFGNSSITSTNITSDNITAKNIGGVIYADQYATIQDAIDACPSDGCDVYIPSGVYNISSQVVSGDGWIGNNQGILLPSNIHLHGAGNSTILQNISANNIGTGSINVFNMISNKDYINGNTNIKISDLSINLAPPNYSDNGMNSWYNAIGFAGVKNSEIYNVETYNGGIAFRPIIAVQNTATVLETGLNSNNLIKDSVSYNVTASSSFFQGVDSTTQNYKIIGSYDDPFLVGSAGKGHRFINNDFNGSSPNGKGGMTANLYFGNDAAVCSDYSCMSDMQILGGSYHNANMNSGGQYGIYMIKSDNIKIIGANIFNNNGTGITAEGANNNLLFFGNSVYNNSITVSSSRGGVDIEADGVNSTNIQVKNNFIYDNGGSGRGIALYSNGNILNIDISGNTIYNQAVGLYVASEPQKTITGRIYNNNISADTPLTRSGDSVIFMDNYGLSPFNFGNVATTPTSFGAGDTYFNTTNVMPCYSGSAGTADWRYVFNGTVGC